MSKLSQLKSNIESLKINLTEEHIKELSEVSKIHNSPFDVFRSDVVKKMITGDNLVRKSY